MRQQFESYLKTRGYSERTPSGLPSTVFQYSKSVDDVCRLEGLSWTALCDEISAVIELYDLGGPKYDIGMRSHKTVINALKRFREFALEERAPQ